MLLWDMRPAQSGYKGRTAEGTHAEPIRADEDACLSLSPPASWRAHPTDTGASHPGATHGGRAVASAHDGRSWRVRAPRELLPPGVLSVGPRPEPCRTWGSGRGRPVGLSPPCKATHLPPDTCTSQSRMARPTKEPLRCYLYYKTSSGRFAVCPLLCQ